ncbi:LysR family transcriptional regulator [Pseudooceanicola sp. HF7]|nr:LysR family transcriptional regulator [Pseudooceanicola sp. HF7]
MLSVAMLSRKLRYFIAVAEDEHFGRAALRLGIAQPALSRQVRLLEAELGFALFERLPRGVRLTRAGQVMLAEMKEVEQRLQSGIGRARQAAAGRHGILRLGLIESAAWHGLVPDALRAYRQATPEADVTLSTMAHAPLLAALRRNEVDAAILYNPLGVADLVSICLARIPIVLALPEDCPLLALPELHLRDLKGYPLVGFQRAASPRLFDDLSAALSAAGFAPGFNADPVNEAEMLALVGMGSGLGLANAMQAWRPPHGVRFAPVRDLNVTQALHVLHRQGDRSPLLGGFLEVLRARAEQAAAEQAG